MNAQLPLALRWPPDQRLDNHVGDPLALEQVRRLAVGEDEAPLLLVGPAGSGKSHLLLGACALAEAGGRSVRYLPLAALAGFVADAAAGCEADLVCIDGLDASAGLAADEVALFHLHNRIRDAGGELLYSARVSPVELGLSLPDLASRLGQCTRVNLITLDDAGRREALVRRAARRGLELDDAVLDYLFRRTGRDFATLGALLDRLDRESLAAQRRITVPFLRALLGG
ncbi:MAG: DnaA regulatory inactivator Hda [Arenimonas sp.]